MKGYKKNLNHEFFDYKRPIGIVRTVAFAFFCSFAMWNMHHVWLWLSSVVGFDYVPATEGMVRNRRFWASVLFSIVLVSGVLNFVWIYWYRRQAVKSAKGQWYDDPSLRKEDLYDAEQREDD